MEESIFEILGIGLREDSFTNLLSYTFETLPEFRINLIHFLLNAKGQHSIHWKSMTRKTVSQKNRRDIPDLILYSHDEKIIIVIENKILAHEGKDQTKNYSSKEFKNKIEELLEIEEATFHYYYLTIDGEKPKSKNFKKLTYSQIVSLIPTDLPDRKLSLLLEELREKVMEYNNWPAPKDNDIVLEYLNRTKGFITPERTFSCLIEQLDMNDLILKDIGITGNRGSAFIPFAKWHLPHWEGIRNDTKGGDGLTCYDIHLEMQWDTKKDQEHLSLQLHYQSLPYYTQKELKKCSEWFRETYLLGKGAFFRELEKQEFWMREEGWKLTNGFLRLASYRFDKDVTMGEFKRKITDLVRSMIPIIDQALCEATITYEIANTYKEQVFEGIWLVFLECQRQRNHLLLEQQDDQLIVVVGANDPSDLENEIIVHFAAKEAEKILKEKRVNMRFTYEKAGPILINGQNQLATREYYFRIENNKL
ncbi:hypothetical protein DNHGIG_28230 [Collibacillus ludicampi]|uniref:PD-(D/E)XK nuclease superfamily protein n=1 Tax=Collibacillus ludicampi TaxID=2771369 RepID=A0AAV4LIJ4_9BACL|nr:PD-(D/E)XK nuclease family protein [Collibacillus ludicampi]GIM47274.1 hypothetical protein DNHGIG_28230 [Collibacillus ludicampi]